jgi:hypothetical protein
MAAAPKRRSTDRSNTGASTRPLRKKPSMPEKRALLEDVYTEMRRLRGGKRAARLRWDEI